MKKITILIPTYARAGALAVTLTSLCYQLEKNFDIIISDQSEDDIIIIDKSVQCAILLLESKGHQVQIFKNIPVRGMAQQRHFLLEKSTSVYSLFLDDDLILEPYVVRNMSKMLEQERCGFVGCAVIGLSYSNDVRAHQQHIEFWEESVKPEIVAPKSKEWNRYVLHNAANIYHIEQKFLITHEAPKKYKVAWVGGCVMYDTEKLKESGGFSFWQSLPEKHCGEDVLAQLKVMKKFGGCGIVPSGVYHQELKTTISDREVNAPEYLEI